VTQIAVKQTLLYAKTQDGTTYALAVLPDDRLAILRDGHPYNDRNDGADDAIGTVDRFIQLIGMASQ
jgi:hypothetical protein